MTNVERVGQDAHKFIWPVIDDRGGVFSS